MEAKEEIKLQDRSDIDLIESVCQLYCKSLKAPPQDIFDVYIEAKKELERRLEQRHPSQMPSEWISIKDAQPDTGVEILLFNESWIEEDYNPEGIRIGFQDDVSGWVTAKYCNYHDCYHTRVSCEDDDQFELSKGTDQIPTHWKVIKSLSQPKEESDDEA